jgi:selenocysteine lyase/cysteine desulfurase
MDVDRYRSETPGCKAKVHLNNAGAGLMPLPVVNAITDHIKLESEIGGYEAQAARSDAILSGYRSVADLLGATPDNIAFTENATASFAQALSAMRFERDDIILTTRNDYASNQIQFLSLQKRLGVKVMRAPDDSSGGVDVSAMSDLISKHQPKLVCVTHVPTNSGLEQDIYSVGKICRAASVIYLVDACQSVGQMPLDVAQIGCDFLSATSRKFMRGPRGSGFLYVSDEILQRELEPLFIDMRGANWTGPDSYESIPSAKRFENWEFPWAQVLGTAVAAEYAIEIGLDGIQQRVRALVLKLRVGLEAIDGVQVLGGDEDLCGIVTAALADNNPGEIVTELREQGINTSAQGREYAVLDYDHKNVAGALRISPHYYNTEDEIDRVVAAITSLVG